MKLRDSFWSETLPCLLGIGAMFLFLVEGNLSAGAEVVFFGRHTGQLVLDMNLNDIILKEG